MGNDGGSIPTRRELVKSAARNPTHSEVRNFDAETQIYRWTTCPLSKRNLSAPVVSDSLGRLYNKDSVLEWLLRKTEAFGDGDEILEGRITSLKDVVQVEFHGTDKGDGTEGHWVCPVTQKELGQGTKAAYIVPCGHAFSASALKELGGGKTECITCNKPYDVSNVIPINSTDPDDIKRLEERVQSLKDQGLTHSLKKSAENRKNKKRKAGAKNESESSAASSAPKKTKQEGIQNAATAGIISKVLDDERLKNSQRKREMSDNLKSLFSAKEVSAGKNNDFMSRGYTIPGSKR